MIHFDGADLRSGLEVRALLDRICTVMRGRPPIPLRTRISDNQGRELLIMPAMLGEYSGIKLLTVTPANLGSARPVISGLYTLFALSTGQVLATMDASELTAQRTSAISAVASERLARSDASSLVVLGAGHLAPHIALAHAMVRPIESIRIWARRADQARAAVQKVTELAPVGFAPTIDVAYDLEDAIRSADIVAAVTSANAPLIKGEWLRRGAHVDLVGSYRPDMREIDDEGIIRSRVFVDDRTSALKESGDLIDPIARGVFSADAICGDLAELCARKVGRTSDDEVTVFKAVGVGIADLIVAIEVWERQGEIAGRAKRRQGH